MLHVKCYMKVLVIRKMLREKCYMTLLVIWKMLYEGCYMGSVTYEGEKTLYGRCYMEDVWGNCYRKVLDMTKRLF